MFEAKHCTILVYSLCLKLEVSCIEVVCPKQIYCFKAQNILGRDAVKQNTSFSRHILLCQYWSHQLFLLCQALGGTRENLNIIRLSPLPWLAQDFPSSFPESPISGNPLRPGQSVTLPVTCQFFRLSCFTTSQWNTYMIFRTPHALCVTC